MVCVQLAVSGQRRLQLLLARPAVLPALGASSKEHSSSRSSAAGSQDRSLCGRGVPFHPSSWVSTPGCQNCLFSVYAERPAQKVSRIIVFGIVRMRVAKVYCYGRL